MTADDQLQKALILLLSFILELVVFFVQRSQHNTVYTYHTEVLAAYELPIALRPGKAALAFSSDFKAPKTN